MIWHLIAALFAGLGAAGLGMLLRLLSGKRIPRWIIPVSAGLGMLAYQIHYEYSWFDVKRQQLPESASIIATERQSIPWRPWTYAFPMVTAFNVVDRESMAPLQIGGEQLVEFVLYRFERQYQDLVTHQTWLMSCSAREALPLDEEQQASQTRVHRFESTAPLFLAVCQ